MANPYKTLQVKVQSQNKLLRANEKSMSRAKLQMQCACAHRDGNGAISLNSPQGGPEGKSKFTNAPLYTCRECYKKLDLSQISQDEFDRSIDIMNRVCDIGKIRLDVKSDRDREMLNDVASVQFKLNTLLPDMFNAIVKGSKNGKKKQRNPYANSIRISR